MTIAKRVRDCRYAKGWGPDELAHRAAISRTALYQIECGKTETPRAGTLRRIAEALEVPIEALLGKEELRLATSPSVATSGPGNGWGATEAEVARTAPRLRGVRSSVRDQETARKFQELLDSGYADSVIRIVDELHRMLEVSTSAVEG